MSTYPATASLPQSGSIVERWLLDEASGNALAETGDNLTDTNSVTAGTGHSGANFSFDNSRDFEQANNEYFTIADNATLSQTGSITFSLWVNPESFTERSPIFSKWEETGSNRSYAFGIRDTQRLEFLISSDGTNGAGKLASVTGSSNISSGTWTHIAAVFEASTRVTTYINGVQDAEKTTSIPAGIFDSARAFWLGGSEEFAGAQKNYDGLANDAIMWSTALTDAEISTLYDKYTVGAVIGSPIFYQ